MITLAAELGASSEFAQRALDAALLHVLAEPADLARLAVDALVATPVEALGAQVGVLLEFPGEGGCGAIKQPAHLLEGLAHAKPRLECRPVCGRHVFLSFGHGFFPLFPLSELTGMRGKHTAAAGLSKCHHPLGGGRWKTIRT